LAIDCFFWLGTTCINVQTFGLSIQISAKMLRSSKFTSSERFLKEIWRDARARLFFSHSIFFEPGGKNMSDITLNMLYNVIVKSFRGSDYKRVATMIEAWPAVSDQSLIRSLPLARATRRSRRSRAARRSASAASIRDARRRLHSAVTRSRLRGAIELAIESLRCALHTGPAHTCSVTRGPAVAAIPDISIDAAAVRDRPSSRVTDDRHEDYVRRRNTRTRS